MPISLKIKIGLIISIIFYTNLSPKAQSKHIGHDFPQKYDSQ